MNASKIPIYIQHRLFGLVPLAAARAAGYSSSGISVAVARLESREDVRQALRQIGAGDAYAGRPLDAKARDAALRAWGLKKYYRTPLDLLLDVMNNPDAPTALRIQCAKDALPFCHAREESARKLDATEAGEYAHSGRYEPPGSL